MKLIIQFLFIISFALPAFAEEKANIVQLTGTIFDTPSSHTTKHYHYLQFQDAESKKSYDVVDSPDIEKLHHETNKNYQVSIEGRITPKFLFWGGNLIISKFNVLGESESVSLNEPKKEFRETGHSRH